MPRFIELSHVIEPGMTTYPGLPAPTAEVLLDYDSGRYAPGTEFLIASLNLCGNTGTYVDAPIHRYRNGTDLASLELRNLADLQFTVVDCRQHSERGIRPEVVSDCDLSGMAVLFHTGFSQHWRTDRYMHSNPFLTAECCQKLVAAGVAFVGIDSVNIDDLEDLARPAHTILLGAEIPICEHMTNLASLPATGGRLHAVPIAWKGGASFPVRAYVVAPR
jgi:kynurenine formamidase